jgi:hypothetical protein
MAALNVVLEPFPVYALNNRFMLFDVNGTKPPAFVTPLLHPFIVKVE